MSEQSDSDDDTPQVKGGVDYTTFYKLKIKAVSALKKWFVDLFHRIT